MMTTQPEYCCGQCGVKLIEGRWAMFGGKTVCSICLQKLEQADRDGELDEDSYWYEDDDDDFEDDGDEWEWDDESNMFHLPSSDWQDPDNIVHDLTDEE